jgi:hypothetical protein
MKKDRFEHHCLEAEAEAGRDAFVEHPFSREEGMVISCSLTSGHMLIKTPDNSKRCWDYRECEDLDHPKSGPMI